MQTYIGLNFFKAEPEEQNGKHGYKVVYKDGYETWLPKHCFEDMTFPINGDKELTEADIDRLMLKVIELAQFCLTIGNAWLKRND